MQERTGRIEDEETIRLKKIFQEQLGAVIGACPKTSEVFGPGSSFAGKWVKLTQEETIALKAMNRKERRKWLSEQRRLGRIFEEIDV